MKEKFEEVYNKILDGSDWDYSTLDELLSLSESDGRTKGKDECKKKAIEAWNTAMIFYTSAASPTEEDALKLFIRELEQK